MIPEQHFGKWANIKEEAVIESARIVLLNTIPLGRKRFEQELPGSGLSFAGWFKKPGRTCDFLQQFLRQFPDPDWEAYEDAVAVPVHFELEAIRQQTAATVDYDVSFETFEQVLHSDLFDLVFLCAHHAQQGVEFADGIYPFQDVEAAIKQIPDRSRRISMVFIVCNADPFAELRTEMPEKIASVATAYWNMPVLGSYQFVKHWTLHLSPRNTLSAAYSEAIRQMIGS